MDSGLKTPLSPSVDTVADKLLNRLKIMTDELRETCSDQTDKQRDEEMKRVENKNMCALDENKFIIEREKEEENYSTREWDRESAIASVAATLVEDAINGATTKVYHVKNDEEQGEDILEDTLSNDYDLFNLNHRSIFRFLQGIEELTEAFSVHNESEGEAKKVLGSLWLMLLKDIEAGLCASNIEVSTTRFFDTMDALHAFFYDNDTEDWINPEKLWPLKKVYFQHLPYYFANAQQFNRDPLTYCLK